MGIFDKAKNLVSSNPDKANQIIDKAGDLVDEKTGGKHAEHVDKGQDLARERLGAGQPEAPRGGAPTQEGARPPAAPPVQGAPGEEHPRA